MGKGIIGLSVVDVFCSLSCLFLNYEVEHDRPPAADVAPAAVIVLVLVDVLAGGGPVEGVQVELDPLFRFVSAEVASELCLGLGLDVAAGEVGWERCGGCVCISIIAYAGRELYYILNLKCMPLGSVA